MKNVVWYRNQWLKAGSTAYQLYMDSQKDPELRNKLDKHLKQLDQNEKDLLKRYDTK